MIAFHVDWYCPNCGLTVQTPNVPNRFHHCPTLGITAPLIRQGTKAKVEVTERQDYVGSDIVTTTDKGLAAMNVTTTRDDGTDVLVFAAAARGSGEA